MIVAELIERLQKMPQDLKIVIQQDTEGNGYHDGCCIGLAYDDEENGYPDVNDNEDLDYIYGVDGDVPANKVVVIV